MTRPVANKGRRGRRPSLYRDAHFHVYREEFRECAGTAPAVPPLVYRGEDSLDPSLHSSPSSFPVSVIPLESTSARPHTLAEVQKRVRMFWRPWNIPPDLFPHRHVTPAPWQDLSVPATITYFHRAITSFGNSRTFTLNLSHAIEAQARAEALPVDWLRRRIATSLEPTLGPAVPFWFTADETDEDYSLRDTPEGRVVVFEPKRLHLHGELSVTPSELARAKAALRRAGGNMLKNEGDPKANKAAHRSQVHNHNYPPDDGWPTFYCCKLLRRHEGARLFKKFGHRGYPNAPTFTGPWFTATHEVRRHARFLYQMDRGEFLGRRALRKPIGGGRLA